jgi:hypothetical protein
MIGAPAPEPAAFWANDGAAGAAASSSAAIRRPFARAHQPCGTSRVSPPR